MIELYTNEGVFLKLAHVSDIPTDHSKLILIQFQDYNKEELEWAKSNFDIDLTIISNSEDIEISSHFMEREHQSSFHFSLPYYKQKDLMVEESVFLVLTENKIFTFTSAAQDTYFSETYAHKLDLLKNKLHHANDLFAFLIAFFTDYYADVTENISKRVKQLATRVLVKKEFKNEDLDTITELNFNNLLIKESINEFSRILTLKKKTARQATTSLKDKIDEELNDLSIISDHIQFNFDRLDDLKENISNKIELEQNKIFKLLTVVTFCISMPTLIAGIYGMNFQNMPGVTSSYGYPAILTVMLLSVVVPLMYFKKKKWL